MPSFLQQVLSILTTSPGILVYHSVIAFTIAATIPVCLYQWRASGFPGGRRAAIGLGLLLLARLVLFVNSSLASQNIFHQLQPALDRAITLIGLVLVIWLWVFPEQVRMGDAAAVLLILLTLVLSAIGVVWWYSQGTAIDFVGSWPDFISEIYALVLIGAGLLFLVLRCPIGWGNGLAMLIVLFLGHIANFFLTPIGKDYQGVVRLAEMIAFPIFLTLPQRFPYFPAAILGGKDMLASHLASDHPDILQSLLIQATEPSPEKGLPQVGRILAQWKQAELCFIASPGKPNDRLSILGGFHLNKNRPIQKSILEGKLAGVISNALWRGRPLRLHASNIASDLNPLKQSLDVERAGHLLEIPLSGVEDNSTLGIILLSPPDSSPWTGEDQADLTSLSGLLARILQHHLTVAGLNDKLAQTSAQLQAIQLTAEQIRHENEDLLSQLENVRQQSIQEHSRAESLAALIASQEGSQETIAQLEAKIKTLQQAADQAQQAHASEVQRLRDELNRVKDESALLHASLIEASNGQVPMKVAEVQSSAVAASQANNLGEQAEVIASIAQELRQPMSSINGYTDLLLSESAGILGALQRKFLERVKASIERMAGLIDDLIQTTSLGRGSLEINPEAVDLNQAIDEAIALTIAQIREKNILLRVDIPEQMPAIMADRDALQQILINLLQNASSATPVEGEISLRATLQPGRQSVSDEQDYVLLRVSDTGGGIPPEDLPRVFSRLYRADNPLIQGVGDTGVGLSIVKTLVEAHHGRVWVDTELGNGSIFNILLPITPDQVRGVTGQGD